MEQHVGRYLHLEEVVHHLNGDKSDNRIVIVGWWHGYRRYVVVAGCFYRGWWADK
jgi:hypothetical protein